MSGSNTFLGTGVHFPIELDAATGRFKMCSEDEDIRESIYIILMTRKNERVMLPGFGCDIHSHVFDLPDAGAAALIADAVENALILWEPRITDIQVELDADEISEGRLYINISYTLRSTNTPGNLVFPYYLYEGIGLR